MRKTKYKGGDRVHVDASCGLLAGSGLTSFEGTVVAVVSDLPVIGHTYVVLAEDPERCGLSTELYPFPAVTVSEGALSRSLIEIKD